MSKQAATIKKNGKSITFQISLPLTKLYYPEIKSGNKYLYYGAEYNEMNIIEAYTELFLLIKDLENGTFDRDNETKYRHKSKRIEVQEKLKVPTLNELVAEYYKEIQRRDLRPGTMAGYKNIIVFINKSPQDVLKIQDIVNYINNSEKGLNTIKNTFQFVIKAYEWGVHHNKLPEEVLKIERLIKYEKDSWLNNKLKKNKRPKSRFHVTSEDTFTSNEEVYNEKEIDILIKEAREKYFQGTSRKDKGSNIPYIIEFISLTGCRISEAIALTWGDIDFDKQQIFINKSYCHFSKKVKCTKTGKSRIFPFKGYNKLVNLLNEIKPDILNKNEIVFKNSSGNYLSLVYLTHIWSGYINNGKEYPGLIRELIDKGLLNHHIPLYNLRHSFITNQLSKGMNPLAVALWVGHDPATQTKHYNKMDGTEFCPID